MPAAITLFHREKLFAKGPMGIKHRHTGARIAVHHLLGGDDFDLIGIGIQAEVGGDTAQFGIVLLEKFKGPFGTFGNGCAAHALCFLKSSRNTG